jgi:hypothetical protein
MVVVISTFMLVGAAKVHELSRKSAWNRGARGERVAPY